MLLYTDYQREGSPPSPARLDDHQCTPNSETSGEPQVVPKSLRHGIPKAVKPGGPAARPWEQPLGDGMSEILIRRGPFPATNRSCTFH
jgi:hypothetical protein